ncbi:oxidoreductase [Staphylococcus simiae]|uniref:2-dehydropantoate 2-reductase n=1 Tax=Staphylococcus simiae CCM 7213 = CCUG 51256 TaxID=911238 RepID=G5JIB6_9STAP|nr:oxidoreductase [Staphylococcus simiae]EHJ08073.1 2-dehydropantoate 2-reductase [Staphylococcus simiae CCM 7213 = CCUG 51256]PNZ12003.1 2-dehydropantoate 2-reductase [Staphylococcus simiae]SNV83000.1 2-dehydropantoate 2-reductase [Staphylococcus simiae]
MSSIAIIGDGAVGTTLAYELKNVLPHTQLIGRTAKTLTYYSSPKSNPASIVVSAYHQVTIKFDYIIIAVKTHQLHQVIKQLSQITHDNTIIILAQNGAGQLAHIPYSNKFQAVVYISGQKKDDVVTHFRDYQLQLQDCAETRQLQQLMKQSNIDIILVPQINDAIWYKLLVNLGINSITAVGRQTVNILHTPEIATVCRQLLVEGCHVAEAEGVVLSDSIVDDILTIYQGYPDEMGTSMYYDIVNNQPLEVEAIQGYIHQLARQHQLSTPYLDCIYSFLHAYQQQFDD